MMKELILTLAVLISLARGSYWSSLDDSLGHVWIRNLGFLEETHLQRRGNDQASSKRPMSPPSKSRSTSPQSIPNPRIAGSPSLGAAPALTRGVSPTSPRSPKSLRPSREKSPTSQESPRRTSGLQELVPTVSQQRARLGLSTQQLSRSPAAEGSPRRSGSIDPNRQKDASYSLSPSPARSAHSERGQSSSPPPHTGVIPLQRQQLHSNSELTLGQWVNPEVRRSPGLFPPVRVSSEELSRLSHAINNNPHPFVFGPPSHSFEENRLLPGLLLEDEIRAGAHGIARQRSSSPSSVRWSSSSGSDLSDNSGARYSSSPSRMPTEGPSSRSRTPSPISQQRADTRGASPVRDRAAAVGPERDVGRDKSPDAIAAPQSLSRSPSPRQRSVSPAEFAHGSPLRISKQDTGVSAEGATGGGEARGGLQGKTEGKVPERHKTDIKGRAWEALVDTAASQGSPSKSTKERPARESSTEWVPSATAGWVRYKGS